MENQEIKVGPFTWIRRDDSGGDECWDLEDGPELVGMNCHCKNYGPGTCSLFSGWRFGSGGPWPEKYASREDAMKGVVPYLIARARIRLDEARASAERLKNVLEELEAFSDAISDSGHADQEPSGRVSQADERNAMKT